MFCDLAKGVYKMINQIIFFIAGCIVTWVIAYFFYRRTPKWAKEFIEHLPKEKPTKKELLQLFQEYLDSGDFKIDPLLKRVACPKCDESAKNFKTEYIGGNDEVTVVAIVCPSCGWSESIDF